MVIVCKFCKCEYANKYTLKRHQQTSKFCLLGRNKKAVTRDCEYCGKSYIYLETHLKRCKVKELTTTYNKDLEKLTTTCNKDLEKLREKLGRKNIKIKKLTSEIRILTKENTKLLDSNKKIEDELLEQQGVVKGMKTAPDKRTIYNTAIHPKLVNLPINNIRALTDEYVMERVNGGILTYEKAARGYPGMLEVICELITHENDEGVIERNYVCTDVSRNSFHRLLESKIWKSDKGGRYLNNMLDTFRDIMEEHKDKVYDKYKNTPHDSIEWYNVEWERKNISKLYSGVVCNEGTEDREELVNILRKEISKRASV